MASPPNLSAIHGLVDQTLLAHNIPGILGESTNNDQKQRGGEDFGAATQTIVDLPGTNDTANNNRKRNADNNIFGTPSTQTTAKKLKTKASDLKYIVPDSVAELKPGSDPVSPSPVAKKTRRKETKASVPRKQKEKSIGDGKVASSSLDIKQRAIIAAHRRAREAANKSTPVSILSKGDGIVRKEDISGLTEAEALKHDAGPCAAGGTTNLKSQVAHQEGRGQSQAPKTGYQYTRHKHVSSDEDEDNDYDDSEEVIEPPQPHQQLCQYDEHKHGGMGESRYSGPQSYYIQPPVFHGGYGGPQPGFSRPSIPFNFNSLYMPPYVPELMPQYEGHQYEPRGMGSSPPQLSGGAIKVGTSHPDLHLNMPAPPTPSLATFPRQVDIPAVTNRALAAPAAPRPAFSHQVRIPAATEIPTSSQSNRPASVYGADQSTMNADATQRRQRRLGRVYLANGHEVMTDMCPGCRRGFE